MQFEEMGNPAGKTLMLLPGTGCTWQINFKNVIEDLGKHFHLICVNYDGFDGDPTVVFPGMIPVTEKIEAYIQQNFGGRLDGVYGSSLSGSFVGLLVQRKQVHIDHGFLGGSDLDQSSPLAAQFYSDLVTPLANDIHVPGATIHVIYALKMGKKYEKRYRKHFRDPDIHPFAMQHEGWMFEKKWAKPVTDTIVACMEQEVL